MDQNKLWKIFKEMGIPEHQTFLPPEKPVYRSRSNRATDWFKTGKGVTLSPCLFDLFTEYACEMSGWMNHKLQSRLPGEISTSDMQIIPP